MTERITRGPATLPTARQQPLVRNRPTHHLKLVLRASGGIQQGTLAYQALQLTLRLLLVRPVSGGIILIKHVLQLRHPLHVLRASGGIQRLRAANQLFRAVLAPLGRTAWVITACLMQI